jgi:hypothetical protein
VDFAELSGRLIAYRKHEQGALERARNGEKDHACRLDQAVRSLADATK